MAFGEGEKGFPWDDDPWFTPPPDIGQTGGPIGGGPGGGGGGGSGPQPPVITPPATGIPGTPPLLGGGGGNGAGIGNSARPIFHFRDAPEFTPPTWNAPTMQDALNEPGYQFRLQGGSDALERSAAARGTLRTGGTLKDVLEYGQNFATQEYGNVFNRALQGYDRNYRGAYDAFLPRFDEWKFLSGAEQAAAMAQFAAQQHGGGGGDPFKEDEGKAPPPPGPPPFLWKPGTTDPDVLAWLEWQQSQQPQA